MCDCDLARKVLAKTFIGSNVTTNTVASKHVASWQQWLDRSVLIDKTGMSGYVSSLVDVILVFLLTGTTSSSSWASDSLRVGITTGLSFE